MLHRLVDATPTRPEIVVLEGRLPRGVDATVHRTRLLGRADRDIVDGIACTLLHRTLVDLGSVVSERALSIAVNRALVTRRTTSTRLLALAAACWLPLRYTWCGEERAKMRWSAVGGAHLGGWCSAHGAATSSDAARRITRSSRP